MAKKTKKRTKAKRRTKSADATVKQIAVNQARMPTIVDPGLRLAWADRMTISVRSDIPVATLSFMSVLGGERQLEAGHIQTSIPHLKRMLDVIASSIDYYPEKAHGKRQSR